jgi:DNA processing protein
MYGAGHPHHDLYDGEYPARLRNIPDPPLVLYIRGRLPVLDEEAALPSSARAAVRPYGIKAAERMGYELSRHGCLVVSGLARGIDTAAAKGALRPVAALLDHRGGA